MLHAQASRSKELIATLISKDRWAWNTDDLYGLTPLHVAASVGSSNECLELLLMRANPNARTISGVTPLHLAARSRSAAAAHVLLEHGAVAEVRDCWGVTALAIAVEVDDFEISSRVLRQNADPWSVSESGVSITQRLGAHQGIRDALALFQKTSLPPKMSAGTAVTSVQNLMNTLRERTDLETSHIRNKNRITQVRLEECLTKLQQDQDQLAASKAATKVLENLAMSAMETHAVDWNAFAETTVEKNTGALSKVQGADPIEAFKHILRHNTTLQEQLSLAKQNIRNSFEERANLDEALAQSKLELHSLKHKFRLRDKQAKEFQLAQQELRLTAEVKTTEAYVSKVFYVVILHNVTTFVLIFF
jgi:ankyrin repeat protein